MTLYDFWVAGYNYFERGKTMTKRQKNRKQKNKISKNAKKKLSLDPIGIIAAFVRKNWTKLLTFIIPFYCISTIIIKFTMLNLYAVPREYILPMLKPSTWDLLNSFVLLLSSTLFILLIELVIKIVKRKSLRIMFYFSASVVISFIFTNVYSVEFFHAIMIFLICFSGTFIYLKLIRSTYEKRKRDIAYRAFSLDNKNIKRYVFGNETFLMLGGYVVLLLFVANIGVMLPKTYTTIDGNIVVSSSFDKYLVSEYTIEHTNNGLEYILIKTNEMDIVKTGKLKKIDDIKTFMRGEKLPF